MWPYVSPELQSLIYITLPVQHIVCMRLCPASLPSLTSLNRVGEMLSGWVQVDDMNRPLHTLAVLHHSTAVGGLHTVKGWIIAL